MATIKHCGSSIGANEYQQIRRAQAHIASYLHFNNGDLVRYLDRSSFNIMADRLAEHFFHRSESMAIYQMVSEIYLAMMIVAPILQRLPLSTHCDWHRGHLLGWFRKNANGRIKRFYFGKRLIERTYAPDLLASNLERLGVHDTAMQETLLNLYRRHCGGTALKDRLAHLIFDPIMLLRLQNGYELRYGNWLFRLEKEKFAGSCDLREQTVQVLDHNLLSLNHRSGRHLEITISDEALISFRSHVKAILSMAASPAHKCRQLETRIRDLVETFRHARSALPQLMDLKVWLAQKLRHIAGTYDQAKTLPNLMVNLWLQRSDHRLFLKSPNLFLNPGIPDEKTYISYFSPYRES